MTLSADDLVGLAPCFGCLDCTHTGFKPKVRFRDLDKPIQDRLRAAEQMTSTGLALARYEGDRTDNHINCDGEDRCGYCVALDEHLSALAAYGITSQAHKATGECVDYCDDAHGGRMSHPCCLCARKVIE